MRNLQGVLDDFRSVLSSHFTAGQKLFIDELDEGRGMLDAGVEVGSGHVAERETLFLLPVHERLRLGMRKECGLCGGGEWSVRSQTGGAGETGTGAEIEGMGAEAEAEVGGGGGGDVIG
jgi:hypothetical protein